MGAWVQPYEVLLAGSAGLSPLLLARCCHEAAAYGGLGRHTTERTGMKRVAEDPPDSRVIGSKAASHLGRYPDEPAGSTPATRTDLRCRGSRSPLSGGSVALRV